MLRGPFTYELNRVKQKREKEKEREREGLFLSPVCYYDLSGAEE